MRFVTPVALHNCSARAATSLASSLLPSRSPWSTVTATTDRKYRPANQQSAMESGPPDSATATDKVWGSPRRVHCVANSASVTGSGGGGVDDGGVVGWWVVGVLVGEATVHRKVRHISPCNRKHWPNVRCMLACMGLRLLPFDRHLCLEGSGGQVGMGQSGARG